MTNKIWIVGTLAAAALVGACSKSKDTSSGATGSAATAPPAPSGSSAAATNDPVKTGLDISLTPTGLADVYLTDEKGQRIDAKGATGRVELPDGATVPLAPADGGQHMTAPLAEHMREVRGGCGATVRVAPREGAERVAQLDLCGGHGTDHGKMGPGNMGHGDMGGGMGPAGAHGGAMAPAGEGHGS